MYLITLKLDRSCVQFSFIKNYLFTFYFAITIIRMSISFIDSESVSIEILFFYPDCPIKISRFLLQVFLRRLYGE